MCAVCATRFLASDRTRAAAGEESAKLEEAERAWRERCAAQGRPAGAPAGAEADTFEVVVPADAQPGDIMTLTTQTGQRMKVVVPDGAEPGVRRSPAGGKRRKRAPRRA